MYFYLISEIAEKSFLILDENITHKKEEINVSEIPNRLVRKASIEGLRRSSNENERE